MPRVPRKQRNYCTPFPMLLKATVFMLGETRSFYGQVDLLSSMLIRLRDYFPSYCMMGGPLNGLFRNANEVPWTIIQVCLEERVSQCMTDTSWKKHQTHGLVAGGVPRS